MGTFPNEAPRIPSEGITRGPLGGEGKALCQYIGLRWQKTFARSVFRPGGLAHLDVCPTLFALIATKVGTKRQHSLDNEQAL